MQIRRIWTLLVALGSLLAGSASAGDSIKGALHKGVAYLKERQNPDGGYGPFSSAEARVKEASDVGITGLVLTAFAKHPRRYKAVDGPFISRAVKFLLDRQQDDGGIYDTRDPVLRNYRTCVAIMALSELDRTLYSEAIGKARTYLESLQLAESGGYTKDEHLSYGANGYGGSSFRGDLSNTGMAAGAYHAAGVSVSHPLWRRLELFVSRVQNSPKLDPLLERHGIGTTGDGGFRYAPNDTRGPVESLDGRRVFRSYGSMTYQGLKSLLYAGVSREDPRVQRAFEWISRNFTVLENPGMASRYNPQAGQQGLYYYYHTMAKALQAYGEPVIVDARGQKHDWAQELADRLIELQKDDGHWVNTSDRWWENIPVLDTAFAVIALSICQEELDRQAALKKEENGNR